LLQFSCGLVAGRMAIKKTNEVVSQECEGRSHMQGLRVLARMIARAHLARVTPLATEETMVGADTRKVSSSNNGEGNERSTKKR